MNLSAKLNQWEQARLISAKQKDAISEYEKNVSGGRLFLSLLLISGFCIGLGIISLICANWEEISDSVKIGGDFLLLLLCGFGIHQSYAKEKNCLAESLLILFAVLILASIGLISQIYNLVPEFSHGMLFWAVLTLPLLPISRKPVLAFVWLPCVVWALTDVIVSWPEAKAVIEDIHFQAPGWMSWLCILAGMIIFQLLPENFSLKKAAGFWTAAAIVVYMLITEIGGGYVFYTYGEWARHLVMTPYANCWFYWDLSAVMLAGYYFRNQNSQIKTGILVLFILICFNFTAAYLPLIDDGSFKILTAVTTILILLVVQIRAFFNHQPRLMNAAAILIALRFLIIYIQVFGSLTQTGVGLIMSGIVFIAIVCIWKKASGWMAKKIKEAK